MKKHLRLTESEIVRDLPPPPRNLTFRSKTTQIKILKIYELI